MSSVTARPPQPRAPLDAPQPLTVRPGVALALPPQPASHDAAAQEGPQAPRPLSSTVQNVEAQLAGVPAARSTQSPAAQVAVTLREVPQQEEPTPALQAPARLSMSDVRCLCRLTTLQAA
jgi:hypothetical protein